MALISATHLTTSTGSTTASISPTANRLVLAAIRNAGGGPPATTPTLSGASMTWTQVATATSVSTSERITVFRALSSSPGSGALTVSGSGITAVSHSIAEFAGVDTSGTNGANAIVQTASTAQDSTNSLTVTLSAFSSSNNATYGAFDQNGATNPTPGSGFTELGHTGSDFIQTQWKNNPDTTVDWSWGGGASNAFAIAIEIKGAPQGGFFAFM